MKSLLISLLFCALTVFGQSRFEFSVDRAIIYNDPLVAGTLVVNMKYDANMPTTVSASPSVNRSPSPTDRGVIATEYLDANGGVVMTEITDYFFRFRFQWCPPNCESSTYKTVMPRFYVSNNGVDSFYTTAISSITLGGRTCSGFQNPSATLTGSAKLWVDLTDGTPCRHEWGNGKTIDFITTLPGYSFSTTAVPDDAIIAYTNGNFRPNPTNYPWSTSCQAPSCKVKIDLILVLDDSGSISNPDWVKVIDFSYQFLNAFQIGPDDVIAGVVKFSWSAELSIPFSTNKPNLLSAVQGLPHVGGATCIGCGIAVATTEITNNGRATAPNVIVLATDGYNNQQTSTFPTVVANAHAVPIEVFGIGVGSFLGSTLDSFVSAPVVDHKFLVSDFNGLSTVLNSVISAACQEIPGSLCGAGCAGLCACATTCVCPPSCDDFNLCTSESCTQGQNNNGCVYSQTNCNPTLDVCNTYDCDPATGCRSVPVNCDDGDPCTVDACGGPTYPVNPNNIQCTHSPLDCADTNICTVDSCDSTDTSGDPCRHNTQGDCSKCQDALNPGQFVDCSIARFNLNFASNTPCNPYVCDPTSPNPRYDTLDTSIVSSGDGPCVARPVVCDDGNPCTQETCATSGANAGQCAYTSFEECDDGDACTDNICDPATPVGTDPCSNPPINVAVVCSDGLYCTVDTCNSAAPEGTDFCVHTTRDCSTLNECQEYGCDELQGGCFYTDRACPTINACYTAACVPQNTGVPYVDETTFNATFCVHSEIPGTINDCGVCLGNDVSCFLESGVAVYAIAGGVIAAIVIAIIIALALGVFGAKKGYDYYQNRKNNAQNWNQESKVYTPKPSGSNPRAA